MKDSFESEFNLSKNSIERFLPKSIMAYLVRIVNNNEIFDSELWAEIIYNYAASWKNVYTEEDRKILLDTLKTLWIGRFVSYANKVKDMDMNEAENVIQRQAEIFEDKFEYLRSIYEDPISPT